MHSCIIACYIDQIAREVARCTIYHSNFPETLAHVRPAKHTRHWPNLPKRLRENWNHSRRALVDADAEQLFEQLRIANAREDHSTSKNYLYVMRMAVYYANGGREDLKLKWNYWKNPA